MISKWLMKLSQHVDGFNRTKICFAGRREDSWCRCSVQGDQLKCYRIHHYFIFWTVRALTQCFSRPLYKFKNWVPYTASSKKTCARYFLHVPHIWFSDMKFWHFVEMVHFSAFESAEFLAWFDLLVKFFSSTLLRIMKFISDAML